MALPSSPFSSRECYELTAEIFQMYVISLLKENSSSFNLDVMSGSDSISFSESDGRPSKWDSEFAFAKCGFSNFIVKLQERC